MPGIAEPKGEFADLVEPISVALEQERKVTGQISELARVARDEGDYVSEQFVQWFLKEQVEEVDLSSLLAVAERCRERPMEIEEYIAREGVGGEGDDPTAPPVAGARDAQPSSSMSSSRAASPPLRWPSGWSPSSPRRGSSLDLALYDVRLPGPAGDRVARALRGGGRRAASRCGSLYNLDDDRPTAAAAAAEHAART